MTLNNQFSTASLQVDLIGGKESIYFKPKKSFAVSIRSRSVNT
jgi:hypothetical protein